jgi:hypothetical protein
MNCTFKRLYESLKFDDFFYDVCKQCHKIWKVSEMIEAMQGKQPEKLHVQREQSRAKGFSLSHKPAESEEAQREKEHKDIKKCKFGLDNFSLKLCTQILKCVY